MCLQDSVPAFHDFLAVLDVVIAKPGIDRIQGRRINHLYLAVHHSRHRVSVVFKLMIVVNVHFAKTSFQAGIERIGRVRGYFGTKQIQRDRVMEIDFLLYGRQVDSTVLAHRILVRRVRDAMLFHDLARTLDHTFDAGSTHEHMVAFLGQHEAGRPRERIEAGRCQ